jgi:hypothetical protein
LTEPVATSLNAHKLRRAEIDPFEPVANGRSGEAHTPNNVGSFSIRIGGGFSFTRIPEFKRTHALGDAFVRAKRQWRFTLM